MDNEERRFMGLSPDEIMKKFIDCPLDDEEKDIYTGIVVNNNDPDKEGKCQIRVYGVFGDNVPDRDLPWALPDFNFIGSKVGSFVVPPVDALVKVYFDRGDIYLPHYTTKAVVKNSQPTQKDTDYPDNMVLFETDDGDYLTINRKSKETTYNHKSGTKVLIKEDGSVEIDVVANKTETIQGTNSQESTGEVTIKGSANVNIESGATLDLKGSVSLVGHGVPVPNATGGPFCGLLNCLFTGAPHQATTANGSTP